MKETIKKYKLSITVATACSLIFFVATSVYWFTNLKADVNSRLSSLETGMGYLEIELIELTKDVESNRDADTEVKVKLASIEAQLAAINSTMLEIKEALK